mmetsp:Transcript_49481/g.74658  ORF Transcript_49481/g.74658 Transcript_49481/m.74658 type:complete len:111 (-) Transcript_49481:48-380(-)
MKVFLLFDMSQMGLGTFSYPWCWVQIILLEARWAMVLPLCGVACRLASCPISSKNLMVLVHSLINLSHERTVDFGMKNFCGTLRQQVNRWFLGLLLLLLFRRTRASRIGL